MSRKGVITALAMIAVSGLAQAAPQALQSCVPGSVCAQATPTPDAAPASQEEPSKPGSVTLLGVGVMGLLMRRPRI